MTFDPGADIRIIGWDSRHRVDCLIGASAEAFTDNFINWETEGARHLSQELSILLDHRCLEIRPEAFGQPKNQRLRHLVVVVVVVVFA